MRLDVLPAASEPCPETTYADQILQDQHHGVKWIVVLILFYFILFYLPPAAARSHNESVYLPEPQSRRGIHSGHARALCFDQCSR